MAAPTEFTIEQVVKIGVPWEKEPSKRTDEVLLTGDNRTWKIYRSAEDPHPAPGQVLKGWKNADKGSFGIATGKGKGGGGGGKKDSDFERRMDHPVQMARVLHTSSLSTAPVLVEQMINFGIVERPADKRAYLSLVLDVAAWVSSTYPQAVQDRAKEGTT